MIDTEWLFKFAIIFYCGINIACFGGIAYMFYLCDKKSNPKKNNEEAKRCQISINKWKELYQ